MMRVAFDCPRVTEHRSSRKWGRLHPLIDLGIVNLNVTHGLALGSSANQIDIAIAKQSNHGVIDWNWNILAAIVSILKGHIDIQIRERGFMAVVI